MHIFHQLEKEGHLVELPWNKVTTLFNLARLLEQLHNIETASILYRLILFKVRLFYLCTCMNMLVLCCNSTGGKKNLHDYILTSIWLLQLKYKTWFKKKMLILFVIGDVNLN